MSILSRNISEISCVRITEVHYSGVQSGQAGRDLSDLAGEKVLVDVLSYFLIQKTHEYDPEACIL